MSASEAGTLQKMMQFRRDTEIYFFTTGSERMRILSGGNVLIGRTSLIVSEDFSCTGYGVIGGTAGNGQFIFGSGGGYTISGSLDNVPHIFRTNNTERMRITSGGEVGIGRTPTSTIKLHVKTASTSGSVFSFMADNNTDNCFGVRADGAIFLGLSASSPYNLTTGTAANAVLGNDGYFYRSTSSLKYKKDIQDAKHGLAEVLQLRPVTYKGKSETDGDTVFGGLIAEEVDAIGLTEFVQYDKDGNPDALAYGNMVSLLAKAIQELNAKVEAQAAEIALLKSK
jgi:hypothetical protein